MPDVEKPIETLMVSFTMNWRWVIPIVFISIVKSSIAQPIIILYKDEISGFGKYTSIFKDSTNNLKIKDVINLSNKFFPCKQSIFSHSPSNYPYWTKFEIKNLTKNDYYLVIDNAYLEDLEVYEVNNKEVIPLEKSGIHLDISSRNIKRGNFVFHINLPPNDVRTYYIKSISMRGDLPLIIGTAPKLMERFEKKDIAWGLFFGAMMIIIIYNLFLFWSLRDINYLLYSVAFFFMGIFRSILMGYSFHFIFPHLPWLNDLFYISNSLYGIFIMWFGLSFLNVKKIYPILLYIGYAFIAMLSIAIVINFIDKALSTSIVSYNALFLTVYMIITPYLILRKGYKPARYYLAATTILLISVVISNLRILDLIPTNSFTINIFTYGLILEAILFSLALGSRYNEYKKEKEHYQNELNKELQISLNDRIKNQEALQNLNQSLIRTNTDLDNFIYTASHDLKVPISNIEGLVNLLNSEQQVNPETKEIYNLILNSVNIFKLTVNDLTEISKIQHLEDTTKQELSVQNIIEEAKFNLKNEIIKSDAKIETDITNCPRIIFSKKNSLRIIENLLSNAIKFRSTDRNLEIYISTQETSDYYILKIKDNGLGIKEDYREKIFSIFKKAHDNKEGRGIGLYIVKRIIDNEGGHIEVDSEINVGSTFKVYIKK